MKFLALLMLAGTLTHASPARAGLDLAWDSCAVAGGDSSHDFQCRAPDGVAQLYGTFQVPDTVENFVAIGIALDIETETGDLPPFWRFEDTGCNEAGVTISDVFPASAGKGAVPLGNADGSDVFSGISAYGPEFETYRNRGRLVCTVWRSASSPITLVPGVDYFAFRLRFFNDNASEAGGRCEGCKTPLTIAWSAATLSTVPAHEGDPPPRDILLTGSGKVSNCVRANGALGRCPERAPPKAWEAPETEEH